MSHRDYNVKKKKNIDVNMTGGQWMKLTTNQLHSTYSVEIDMGSSMTGK